MYLSILLAFSLLGFSSPAIALKPDEARSASGVQKDGYKARALSRAQQKAAELAAEDSIKVEWRADVGTPLRIRGTDLSQNNRFSGRIAGRVTRGGRDKADAVAVLGQVSALFGIKDASKEFTPGDPKTDAMGFRHIRSRQIHNGRRVVGGELLTHFDRAGKAYEVNGRYVADIAVEGEAKIGADDAVAAARKALEALGEGTLTRQPELVVFAMESEPKLSYELELTFSDPKSRIQRWRVWIDAHDGTWLCGFDDVKSVSAPSVGAPATISGQILAREGGGVTSVAGWRETSSYYYLYSTNRTWCIYNVALSGYPDNNTYAYRSTADWGGSDLAEMSAAANFETVQLYFWGVHGRRSFDGAGAYAVANMHKGTQYVNAYWDGAEFYFGDGDTVEADPLGVLDIVGHEYTHAVTEHSANLYYYGESGALNESISDIMGSCVEFYAQDDDRANYPNKSPGKADWLCGEDAWISSKALRDLRNPHNVLTVGAGNEQPSRYKGTYWYSGTGDNGGVHYNSGVQNFFFYLLCEGGTGTNDGIYYSIAGIDVTNAEKVAYRALTEYMGEYTDHSAARSAWISAATDLNTNWVPIVEAAWLAVGVGPVLPSVATPTFNPPDGVYNGSSLSVTVTTTTAGATIRYTLDGVEPNETSQIYTDPLVVTNTTTIKAKGYKGGMAASATASATYSFLGTRIYSFPMDVSPGWSTAGQWAFGQPTGKGGSHGNPDPTNGYSGANVYGYNLNGDYANSLSVQWLTTTVLDMSGYSNVRLAFRRWLGVEQPLYDKAYIDVSTNGTTWQRKWTNPSEMKDSEWVQQVVDIASPADQAATVYIRWGMGPTDSSWTYCGWNIDDVEIWGTPLVSGPPAAPSGMTATPVSSTNVVTGWRDNSDNEQGFSLERMTGAGPWVEIATFGANVVSANDTSVVASTSYSYRVHAFNTEGDSAYSKEAVAETPADTGDAYDPGDDTGAGASELAGPLVEEQVHGQHTLSPTDSYDWFKVYLSEGINYNFNSLGGEGDVLLEVYADEAGTVLAGYDDDGGGNLQFSLDFAPMSNAWYYLRVRCYNIGEPAGYSLKYKVAGFTTPPVYADFSEPVIETVNTTVLPGSGFANPDRQPGYWFIDEVAGGFTGSFTVESAGEYDLVVVHKTAYRTAALGEGYAPVTIQVNGADVARNYDVAQSNSGSHSFEVDIWRISALAGENSYSWTADALQSDYRIKRFEIYPTGTCAEIVMAINTSGSATWTRGGDANWYSQTAVSHDGVSAARSGAITNNQHSWLQTTVTGPGTLRFYWKVSSEPGYDGIVFYMDNVPYGDGVSGESEWLYRRVTIADGVHVIRWDYVKDESLSFGSDCGWLDNVTFTPLRRVGVPWIMHLLLN